MLTEAAGDAEGVIWDGTKFGHWACSLYEYVVSIFLTDQEKLVTILFRTLFIIALLLPTVSAAEYNGRKLAIALGAYLRMVATFEYLQSTECSYIIQTNFSLDQSSRDALLHFENKDRKEMKSIIKKQNFLNLVKVDIDGALKAFKQDGLDRKSGCGMLLGTLSNTFSTIRDDYERAISMYSK